MPNNDVTTLIMDLRMTTSNLSRDIRSARGILAGIGAAVGLTVTQFAKADDAARTLKSALAANDMEVGGNVKRMTEFAQAMRNATTLSVPYIQSLQTMALRLGVSAEQTNAAVQAGIGIGEKFFNGDAAAGVRAVSLSILGQTERMGEYIPALRRAKTETEKLAILNKVASQGFEEAKAKVGTFSGSILTLRRSFTEAGAAIGQAFAPQVQALSKLLEGVAEKVSAMSDSEKAALVTQTELVAGAAAGTLALSGLGKTMTGLRAVFGAALKPVGAIGVALAGVGHLFVNLVGNGETFGERLNDVWERLKVKVGEVGAWIETKWTEVTNGIVQMYFQVLEAFGEGDADKMMRGYLEDVERSAKETADRAAEAAKAGMQKQKGIYAEGARSIVASIKGIGAAYNDVQLAILKYQEAGGKKPGVLGPIFGPPLPPGRAGAENAAIMSGDERARVEAVERDRRRRGEPTPTTPAARAAANVARARAEIEKIDRQLLNLEVASDDENTEEDQRRRGGQRLVLEARRRAMDSIIARNGQEKQNTPFSKDEAVQRLMKERDRLEQTGDTDANRLRVSEAFGVLKMIREHPQLKRFVETPDSKMNKQFGANLPSLDEAAKKMGQAGDVVIQVFKKAKTIAIVKPE